MYSLDRVTFLQQKMAELIKRVIRPLSYFDAKNSVISAATTFIQGGSMYSRKGIHIAVSQEVIDSVRHAGITQEDLEYLSNKHNDNNALLRRLTCHLMLDNNLSIQEAHAEIDKVLAGENQKFAGSYKQELLAANIAYIDLAHVFEDCHVKAIHAMITISNLSPDEAFQIVVESTNTRLKRFPVMAKDALDYVEGIALDYINNGVGAEENLKSYIVDMHKSQVFGFNSKTPDQYEKINSFEFLFIKNIVSPQFIKRMLAKAGVEKINVKPVITVTPASLHAALNTSLASLNVTRKEMPIHTVFYRSPQSNSALAHADNMTPSLSLASRYMTENPGTSIALLLSATIVCGLFVTGCFKKPLAAMFSFFYPSDMSKKRDDEHSVSISLLSNTNR